jgi:hypothetical protein
MTRTDRVRRVEPGHADGYAEVGRRLLAAGRTIVAAGDPRHAPALAILAVHAAIAYADAVTIRTGGRKSASADHSAALKLLRAVLGNRLPPAMERLLARVLAEKDRFEYQGYVATMAEAARTFEAAEKVGAWAEGVLASVA